MRTLLWCVSGVYVSRLCSGTASGLFMRPAAARSSASAAPPCGLLFPSKSCSDKAPEKISPDPPQMQSFGTWEHGPLAQLVPRPRSGDSTNGDTHVPISYVELGRFCQRDLPRCPWPSSARRRRCNDELAADERPGRRARSANHAVEENRIMKSNQLICEIRWDRVPLVADQKDARAWLGFQACRGLALNTLDAYGRNLERYLRFLSACGKKPHEIGQETVGAYLRDLVKPSATSEEPDIRMANATIQQHLAALRMFYDFLVEEERCTRPGLKAGNTTMRKPRKAFARPRAWPRRILIPGTIFRGPLSTNTRLSLSNRRRPRARRFACSLHSHLPITIWAALSSYRDVMTKPARPSSTRGIWETLGTPTSGAVRFFSLKGTMTPR